MNEVISNNLTGKVLIASPYTMNGNIFHKSIIYVLSHTPNGAVGLIVNHKVNNIDLNSVFKGILKEIEQLPLPIHLGGPVEMSRGFFLRINETSPINQPSISSSNEILDEINGGELPKQSLFVMGYTGWTSGQLEFEIENNLWIVDDYRPSIIFNEEDENKWNVALQNLGINDASFASIVGHS